MYLVILEVVILFQELLGDLLRIETKIPCIGTDHVPGMSLEGHMAEITRLEGIQDGRSNAQLSMDLLKCEAPPSSRFCQSGSKVLLCQICSCSGFA